jgi:hypothetical protein
VEPRDSLFDEEEESDAPLVPADDESVVAGFDSVELFAEPLVAVRSFLAQPEPLKMNDVATTAFVIRASVPHDGQNRGPASWIP